MNHSLMIVNALTITCITGLSGQVTVRDGRLLAILSGARSTAEFRVRTATGAASEGTLVRFDSTTLRLHGGNPIPLAQIDRVWEKGRAWDTGAIIGTIVGGAGGAVLGSAAAGICEGDCPTTGQAAGIGALLGAAAGFVVGVGIGSLVPKWRLRFP